MPPQVGPADPGGEPVPRLSFFHRLLLGLPRLRRRADKAPIADRLRDAFLKPADQAKRSDAASAYDLPLDELEVVAQGLEDRERLFGLFAAPLAGAVGLVIISTLIANDPAAHLKSGAVNPKHVSVGLYHTLGLVILALAAGMLLTAFFRKRLYLGMVMALYGLAIFNLKYWGFGVPFVMGGAYYLVRAYRFQRAVREATAGGGAPPREGNRRYTPPSVPRSSLSSRSRARRPRR